MLDAVHLFGEFFIDSISKHLALLIQLALHLGYFDLGAGLHVVDLQKLMLQLGDAGIHAGCTGRFHAGIFILGLAEAAHLLFQAGFQGCKLSLSHRLACRGIGRLGRCNIGWAIFAPRIVMSPWVSSLQMFDGFLGGNNGVWYGISRWLDCLDLCDQDVTMLQGIYPMAWVLDCLYVPSDTASILRSALGLDGPRIPLPRFEEFVQGSFGG